MEVSSKHFKLQIQSNFFIHLLEVLIGGLMSEHFIQSAKSADESLSKG